MLKVDKDDLTVAEVCQTSAQIAEFLGKIYTYETSEVFMDIGTPDSYAQANTLM